MIKFFVCRIPDIKSKVDFPITHCLLCTHFVPKNVVVPAKLIKTTTIRILMLQKCQYCLCLCECSRKCSAWKILVDIFVPSFCLCHWSALCGSTPPYSNDSRPKEPIWKPKKMAWMKMKPWICSTREVEEQAMEYKTIHTSIYIILSKQSRMQPGFT